MINSTQFFQKYNKRFLDYDGLFGSQCVDLIKSYFVEVLGLPPHKGNAIDYWTTPPQGFQKIANKPYNAPQPDDIVIWKATRFNPYGHIAICNWSRLFDLGVFEQNNPIGSPCHFQDRNYSGVVGWLRPIKKPATAQIEPSSTIHEVPLHVVGNSIPGLHEQVSKWSRGSLTLKITHTPMRLPYNPYEDFSKYATGRFCIVSCLPAPEIYKTSLLDGLETAYAIAGPDALTCSYELSHMLHLYYLTHRGTNPYIDNEDTMGGVTDEQRYRKYDVMKPYLSTVILKP